MLTKEQQKKKKELKEALDFYLDYYKEVSGTSQRMQEAFDKEIEEIIEELKQLGK